MNEPVIKFGPSQWGNKVPGKIKVAYQLIMFFSALWLLVQPQFPGIPAVVCSHIDHIMALGLPTLYLVCQCFGVEVPDGSQFDMLTMTAAMPAPIPTAAVKIDIATKALDKAKADLAAAVKAKAELPADATNLQKGAATRAVNSATIAVDEAQAALDELVGS